MRTNYRGSLLEEQENNKLKLLPYIHTLHLPLPLALNFRSATGFRAKKAPQKKKQKKMVLVHKT